MEWFLLIVISIILFPFYIYILAKCVELGKIIVRKQHKTKQKKQHKTKKGE